LTNCCSFLGTNKHQWYGLGVIKDIINGVEWESSGYFPRSAICDFEGAAFIVPDYSTSVERFVFNYLHRDGVFVLRMVSSHAGIIFGKDLIHALWNAFYGIEKKVFQTRIQICEHTNCY
uniref:Methyltransferase n=1 Tax=Angiostrongylus cantonensis TaxID=6313 RepID=A0A0K0D4I1_ANGCA